MRISLIEMIQFSGRSVRKFWSARDIPLHLRKYKCTDCDKAYSQKSHLYRHQKMECNKEPKYKCPYCYYVSTYRYYLKVHINRKHHIIVN